MPRRLAPLALVVAVCACAAGFPPPEVVITIKPTTRLIRRSEGVHVHLETGDPLSLEVRGTSSWTSVCDAPCDKGVDAGETYRVVREGRAVTDNFVLDAPAGSQITIAVGWTEERVDRPSTPWLQHLF
jgi:hypothetical protein